MINKEVVLQRWAQAEDCDEREESAKKEGVHFVLEYVVRDWSYSKWFDLLGVDLKTGNPLKIPIRNNVVDSFVEEHWPEFHHQGLGLNHWDLYNELAANRVPMVWSEDSHGYFMPVKWLSNTKWKRLYWHMKQIGIYTDRHVNTLPEARRAARSVTVWRND